MNTKDPKYQTFGLIKDMLATPAIIREFDCAQFDLAHEILPETSRILLTGEGSSRLVPGKHAIKLARQRNYELDIYTEAGCQASDYPLYDTTVFALSNSGRTAEAVALFKQLQESGHGAGRISITAHAESVLETYSDMGYVLSCGDENAVAATKSVVEQALSVQALIEGAEDRLNLHTRLDSLADAFEAALEVKVPEEITKLLVDAPVIAFAGPNDGVAEELRLKTNEITRKRADFFEGTYASHGVEEVLTEKDVVIWIDPIEWQEEKFEDVLVKGAGVNIIAISSRPTRFPTIQVPDAGDLSGLVYLAAGWNLLVEAGLALGIDIDKPERARKVGNEYTGG